MNIIVDTDITQIVDAYFHPDRQQFRLVDDLPIALPPGSRVTVQMEYIPNDVVGVFDDTFVVFQLRTKCSGSVFAWKFDEFVVGRRLCLRQRNASFQFDRNIVSFVPSVVRAFVRSPALRLRQLPDHIKQPFILPHQSGVTVDASAKASSDGSLSTDLPRALLEHREKLSQLLTIERKHQEVAVTGYTLYDQRVSHEKLADGTYIGRSMPARFASFLLLLWCN
jgi:hypothetical protein